MHTIRKWIRALFGFSRTETNAFLLLLPIMLLLVLAPVGLRQWHHLQMQSEKVDHHKLDSLVAHWKWSDPKPAKLAFTLSISFDPNHTSSDTLLLLGLPEPLTRRIVAYRKKGGQFRSQKDFRKMFTKDSALFKKIQPLLRLPSITQAQRKTALPPFNRPQAIPRFDLNLADTTQLIRLRGIGPKLSQRILRYRERLGGFVEMKQLTEVFGLDSLVIAELNKRSFIDPHFVPHQINLNLASEKELSAFPYLRFAMAKAIVAWRFQHGPFQQVEDIRQLKQMDETVFQKIKPYLGVKD